MADFEPAIIPLLASEGGYSDRSADRGGPTKYGISQKSYPGLDIKNLTVTQAKAIYKKDYWDKIKGDKIKNQNTAYHIFDIAVNSGPGTAAKLTQQSLNQMGYTLAVDNAIGPLTLAALNTANQAKFNDNLYNLRIKFYNAIVSKDASQMANYNGWLNRAKAVIDQSFTAVASQAKSPNTLAVLSIGLLALYIFSKKQIGV
jgi:lysozyme family protein